ncbi:3-phosphoshikimate 1-carboxyvinyltransferase [Marinitoga piezophila KA3]|uniref:3-phosphoshikimate 1-carboxyvinyltransferase n=1 Tax=Marinitoga piezophila (strain DSM 14283 / JCM 11233 / KA3) TaxID=443254 RepID=H2J2R7_MARPK|nr:MULTISPECIES: 3-phosphoshikimate 1-carboxyvinyltransferase [Marinitoga]AEX84511.1 3-phosphoshikimate 1-carboxyvinyltransferase [Marinitoga piezophila KA3]APT75004.1 3-phosphoshikimate 1-carboxyvinyltransferase [Marinitoga sp. 1137]
MRIMPIKKIRAKLSMPADKSITHRALILSSLAKDESIINNLLLSEDTKRTFEILKKIGMRFSGDFNKLKIIPQKIKEDKYELYCGNSGTTARLLSGYFTSKNGLFLLTGDQSLSKRPMKRVVEPLRQMGANIETRNNKLPLKIIGGKLKGIDYTLPISSAQVKSAIIIAGLDAEGKTIIRGDKSSRDHTERMLEYMGANIKVSKNYVEIQKSELYPLKNFYIPGDISSAAFFITLGILHENAKITIENVGLNNTRMGYIEILKSMGANIEYEIIENEPEPYGNIYVETSKDLHGIEIPENLIPAAIDELPLLALVGTNVDGKIILRNATELRVKESDRIKSIVDNFKNLGIRIKEYPDGFEISGKQRIKGGKIETFGDHRIAMMFGIAGLISEEGIYIENEKDVEISFPEFFQLINQLSKEF